MLHIARPAWLFPRREARDEGRANVLGIGRITASLLHLGAQNGGVVRQVAITIHLALPVLRGKAQSTPGMPHRMGQSQLRD